MTGRHLLRTLGIALGCATAAILSPAIAHAAPGDVTITPSVSGNSVTVTVTNRSAAVIGCKMFGLPAGSVANSDSRPPFGYVNPVDPRALIAPGGTRTVALEVFDDGPTGSTVLPDGDWDLYWGCTTVPGVDGVEQWGTLGPTGKPSTAPTTRLTLPAAVGTLIAPTPMPPGPCPDASCLPPDAADIVDDLWGEYTSP
ncbi:hypothetical protein [Gordonia terrae]|uniref:DUF4232 domain-containing protein n=2 Tax=Gordonia terrae TaxID=2055 RepID=A0AAD0NYT9_9ACTN|nr:hypothetical protein [Gordonia terrae]VTR12365.1 Uncharacterised protein [Clostridioides difficile]ANY24849.1 hypothetical protein BCM27_20395 [Gordonia terrae]AWO85597.1 hypothetical protein DLJ61_20615 [Gordonia terrae]VTS60534.1 Uncharacterised protein [Gordonia terrae]GAB45183.1 hypothetical protein GOTRE_109_00520 [Gordonia terrae NBRC 100016]